MRNLKPKKRIKTDKNAVPVLVTTAGTRKRGKKESHP